MRYGQTKEQSAEVLRLAFEKMRAQPAGFNPLTVAVWYEEVAGINARLSEALQQTSTPVDDVAIARLHARYIAGRDLEAFERATTTLRHTLDMSANTVTDAQSAAVRCKATLNDAGAELTCGDPKRVAAAVDCLVTETGRLLAALEQAISALARDRGQVAKISQDFEQSESEPIVDPLTRLFNRRGLQQALDRVELSQRGDFALLVIDVDRFSDLNARFGHPIGDKVLWGIAELIRARVRPSSIAARVGPDAFAIAIPRLTVSEARELAERLREAIAQMVIQKSDRTAHPGEVTASFGVTIARSATEGFELLGDRAEHLLRRATQAGGNRVYLEEDVSGSSGGTS